MADPASFRKRMGRGSALGKVILLGEHAVVYGVPAIAAALSEGVSAWAMRGQRGRAHLSVPSWGLQATAGGERVGDRAFAALCGKLGLGDDGVEVVGEPQIPAGAGLGASAALAVAAARAIAELHGRKLTPAEASEAAFASEMVLHGNASGIDNALAAYGGVRVFRRGEGLSALRVGASLKFVIGHSGEDGSTLEMVEAVASLHRGRKADVEQRFADLAALVGAAQDAIMAGDRATLGECLIENHAILRWLGVSTFALDKMVDDALDAGALGAKLTGGGGGGSAIALVDGDDSAVLAAWRAAGHTCITTEVRGSPLPILAG